MATEKTTPVVDVTRLRPFQKNSRATQPQGLVVRLTNNSVFLNRVVLDALGRPAYVQFWLDEADRVVLCGSDHFNGYVVVSHGHGGYVHMRPVVRWAKDKGHVWFSAEKSGKYLIFAPMVIENTPDA